MFFHYSTVFKRLGWLCSPNSQASAFVSYKYTPVKVLRQFPKIKSPIDILLSRRSRLSNQSVFICVHLWLKILASALRARGLIYRRHSQGISTNYLLKFGSYSCLRLVRHVGVASLKAALLALHTGSCQGYIFYITHDLSPPEIPCDKNQAAVGITCTGCLHH